MSATRKISQKDVLLVHVEVQVYLGHKHAVEYKVKEGPDECRALTVLVLRPVPNTPGDHSGVP